MSDNFNYISQNIHNNAKVKLCLTSIKMFLECKKMKVHVCMLTSINISGMYENESPSMYADLQNQHANSTY